MAIYEDFKDKVFSAFQGLAKDFPSFEDAQMIVGSSDATASLHKQDIYKTIDTDWIDAIEKALPALDVIIRNPSVLIEDVDEVLPVELSRHVTEKSIKHLAQHTNLISTIKKDGEVVPQKILNVYHDETMITYENKFINTLLARLSAFVDKRFKILMRGSGVERKHKFNYQTEFDHQASGVDGNSLAKIELNIELTIPQKEENENIWELKDKYAQAVKRIKQINLIIMNYQSSAFAKALGKNYIRPPVIRTNVILKNKNFKECLNLWEFIESFDKQGYAIRLETEAEMPSESYISDLYSSVALQYTNFYNSIVEQEDVRLLSDKHIMDIDPTFEKDFIEEEFDEYMVYDTEYKKKVPVSRLMNNRKKLSEDEKRIYNAINTALRADEIMNQELREAEKELKRLELQRRREEEERRKQEEEARKQQELLASMPVAIRYRRSFLSRYIQAEQLLQDYYTQIKNKLLSYEGVKSKISWSADSFHKGRNTLAKIDVKGKRLYLYLAIEPKELEGSKYRFVDVSKRKPDQPVLLKIKGKLGFMHAMELIDLLAIKFKLEKFEREFEDFSMPYEEDEALREKKLIKVILPKGATLSENTEVVKDDVSKMFENIEKQAESRIDVPIAIRYRRSFLSRYIQADGVLQEYYTQIKNRLLSLKGMKSRISWKGDTFRCGRVNLAKIDVRGKRLYVYFAIEPGEIECTKYNFKDLSAKKGKMPLLMRIKGKLGYMHTLELIDIVAQKYQLQKIEREFEDYTMPYKNDNALIKRGLIKVVAPQGTVLKKGTLTVKENVGSMLQQFKKKMGE